MANKAQILAKIARNAQVLGLTVNSQSSTAVVIENDSNDLTITYVDASVASPMGGVDASSAPFLGMGVVQPGKIKISGAQVTKGSANTWAEAIDSLVAGKVLAICSAFGNNVIVEKPDTVAANTFTGEIAGDPMLKGMGL